MPRKKQVCRLPNGYGAVKKLSGRRNNAYGAFVNPRLKLNEANGKSYYEYDLLDSFNDRGKALAAVIKYKEDPYDLENKDITMQELYEKWSVNHFDRVSKTQKASLVNAWAYCRSIYGQKVKDIKSATLKACIENAKTIGRRRGPSQGNLIAASINIKLDIKSLFNMMFDYANEMDIVKKNYSRAFELDITSADLEAKNPHIAFSDNELTVLWKNTSMPYVDMILIGCYSSWRPNELCQLLMKNVDVENATFIGGSKTEAGKNRTIPIHSAIFPLVKRQYELSIKSESPYLFNILKNEKVTSITFSMYKYGFDKVVAELELNMTHRPHDTRHTFGTLSKYYKVNDYARKVLMGHKIADLTDDTYTHMDISWFRSELEKIKK